MGENKATVSVKTIGMSCSSCEKLIEMTLKKEPGIESVKANKDAMATEVTFDPDVVSVDTIVERINGLGYSAEK